MRIRLHLEQRDPGLRRLSIDPPAGDPAAPGAGGSGSSGAAPPAAGAAPTGAAAGALAAGAPASLPAAAAPAAGTPSAGAPASSEPAAGAAAQKDEQKPPAKDDLSARLERQEQELARLRAEADRSSALAKRQTLRAFFSDIVDDDLIGLAPTPEFTDSGELTADSRRKLTEWRAAKPHYFTSGGDAGRRSTPNSQGGGVGEMTPEIQAQLSRAGIPVVDNSKNPNAHKLAFIFGRRQ